MKFGMRGWYHVCLPGTYVHRVLVNAGECGAGNMNRNGRLGNMGMLFW